MERNDWSERFASFVNDAIDKLPDYKITALEPDMYDERDDYEVLIDLKNSKEDLISNLEEVCKHARAKEDELTYERACRVAIYNFQTGFVGAYTVDAKNRHKVQEFCDQLLTELIQTEGAGSEIEFAQLRATLRSMLYGNEADQQAMVRLLNKIRKELDPGHAERILGINPEDLERPVDLEWLNKIIVREWLRVLPERFDGCAKTTEERINDAISEASQAFDISLRDDSPFETSELVAELFEPFWISILETKNEKLSSEPKEGSIHEFRPKKK